MYVWMALLLQCEWCITILYVWAAEQLITMWCGQACMHELFDFSLQLNRLIIQCAVFILYEYAETDLINNKRVHKTRIVCQRVTGKG